MRGATKPMSASAAQRRANIAAPRAVAAVDVRAEGGQLHRRGVGGSVESTTVAQNGGERAKEAAWPAAWGVMFGKAGHEEIIGIALMRVCRFAASRAM